MSTQLTIPASIKILIISDTGAVRDILTQGLKTLGLKEIEFQSSGMIALRTLRNARATDIILCERDLPDMSGFELLREISEADDIVAGSFVLVSSTIAKADVAMAGELGCDGYLVKPFTMRDLAQKITHSIARSSDPACFETRFRYAKNLGVQGRHQEALTTFQELRNSSASESPSARIAVGMGRCHRKLGDIPSAIAEFDRAIAANALYVHAYQERGMCLLDTGKTDDAIKEFESAITISPNNPVRYEIIAEILYKAEKYEQAELYLMRAISLELAYPELFAQLGKTLFAQKKPEKAAQFFEKALKRDPKNTSFLNSLGICYKELGKVDAALERYNLALKINPSDVKVLFNKALCLTHQNEFDRAQKAYELILRIDSSYTKATAKLAELPKLKAAALALAEAAKSKNKAS
jgi:tetratricopeptide (TPR) repeat protein